MLEKKTLTLYELISLIISFLGLISLIVGLISLFIIYSQTQEIATQTRHSATSLRSTAYKSITDQAMEVDRLFVEHSRLRPYFYSGKEIGEDSPDYAEAEAIAEYELDFFDSAQHQLEYLETLGEIDMKEWNAYFDDSFKNSPILCKRLNKISTWYRSKFVEHEKEVCSEAASTHKPDVPQK